MLNRAETREETIVSKIDRFSSDDEIDRLVLPSPQSLRPWKFPNSSVVYKGTIFTTPVVGWRLDNHGNPSWTSEGARRWSLWMSVETDDGYRGFRINNNSIARAFNGRASERNLRRWADQWKVGDRLQISWTWSSPEGRRYHGRRYSGARG